MILKNKVQETNSTTTITFALYLGMQVKKKHVFFLAFKIRKKHVIVPTVKNTNPLYIKIDSFSCGKILFLCQICLLDESERLRLKREYPIFLAVR